MNILPLLYTLGYRLPGYLCGSLPFAAWITRLAKGVVARDNGKGILSTSPLPQAIPFGLSESGLNWLISHRYGIILEMNHSNGLGN